MSLESRVSPGEGGVSAKKRIKYALLYMGTGNNNKYMLNAKRILKEFGFKVTIERWNLDGKNSVNYVDAFNYNISPGQSKQWDMVCGHSAGGFPTSFSFADIRIGFNVFLDRYPAMDYVFHGTDDWLVVKDRPDNFVPLRELILYKGGHSDFPKRRFENLLEDLYGT